MGRDGGGGVNEQRSKGKDERGGKRREERKGEEYKCGKFASTSQR